MYLGRSYCCNNTSEIVASACIPTHEKPLQQLTLMDLESDLPDLKITVYLTTYVTYLAWSS